MSTFCLILKRPFRECSFNIESSMFNKNFKMQQSIFSIFSLNMGRPPHTLDIFEYLDAISSILTRAKWSFPRDIAIFMLCLLNMESPYKSALLKANISFNSHHNDYQEHLSSLYLYIIYLQIQSNIPMDPKWKSILKPLKCWGCFCVQVLGRFFRASSTGPLVGKPSPSVPSGYGPI